MIDMATLYKDWVKAKSTFVLNVHDPNNTNLTAAILCRLAVYDSVKFNKNWACK